MKHFDSIIVTFGLELEDGRASTQFLLLLFLKCLGLCLLISVLYCYSLKNVSLTTYVTEAARFFHFPPAGPQTKGLVKQQADFPTQFRHKSTTAGS